MRRKEKKEIKEKNQRKRWKKQTRKEETMYMINEARERALCFVATGSLDETFRRVLPGVVYGEE